MYAHDAPASRAHRTADPDNARAGPASVPSAPVLRVTVGGHADVTVMVLGVLGVHLGRDKVMITPSRLLLGSMTTR